MLDLRESYREYRGPELWVHVDDQHPNEIAHAIAADTIAEHLLAHRSRYGLDVIGQRKKRPDRGSEAYWQARARLIQLRGRLLDGGAIADFSNIPLSDFDLRLIEPYWRALDGVRELRLAATDITDASLPALAEVPELERLDVSGTKATALGVAKLRARFPNLSITF